MVRGGGMTCVKYLLFAFNFIFVLCGIALIAVGAYVFGELSPQKEFYSGYLGAPVALIVLGAFIFILAFLGCCGAIKENHCMIMTFSILLSLILISELGAAIAAYVYRGKIKTALKEGVEETFEKYNISKPATKSWDDAQTSLKCCGAEGPEEYRNKTVNGGKIPWSCCQNQSDATPDGFCPQDKAYKKSCLDALEDGFRKNIAYVGGVGIGIAFIEVIGIIFGCCLAHSIKKNYEVV